MSFTVEAAEPRLRPRDWARELHAGRDILLVIVWRHLRLRYRRPIVGLAWALLQPALFLAVVLALLGAGRTPSRDEPVVAWAASVLPWTFFASSLAFGVPSVLADSNLVRKVFFARELLPVGAVLSGIPDLVLSGSVVCVLAWLSLPHLSWTAAAWVVPLAVAQVAYTCGVTLMMAGPITRYRHLRYAVPLVGQLFLVATPVTYDFALVPSRFRAIYVGLNPMAAVVGSVRSGLATGDSPAATLVLGCLAASLCWLAAGYLVFKLFEDDGVDGL